MTATRLNAEPYITTRHKDVNVSISGGGRKEVLIDISDLKAAYDNVQLLGYFEVTGGSYYQFSFEQSWISGNNAYVTLDNRMSSAQTLGGVRIALICTGKKLA